MCEKSVLLIALYCLLISPSAAQTVQKVLLPPYAELPLASAVMDLEDCYGYNVKIYKLLRGKCMYSKTTYTTCTSDTNCQPLNNTVCMEGYCQCKEGFGITHFLIDTCAPMTINERWKYEHKRFPDAIKTKVPWGEAGEYNLAAEYNGVIIFLGFGVVGGAIVSLIGEWWKDAKKAKENPPPPPKQEAKKEEPVAEKPTPPKPKASQVPQHQVMFMMAPPSTILQPGASAMYSPLHPGASAMYSPSQMGTPGMYSTSPPAQMYGQTLFPIPAENQPSATSVHSANPQLMSSPSAIQQPVVPHTSSSTPVQPNLLTPTDVPSGTSFQAATPSSIASGHEGVAVTKKEDTL